MSEKKIILTDEEKAVIEKELNGEFDPIGATDQEKTLFCNVIHSAEALCKELDAYEEIEGSLIEWYYNKYKAQE